MLKSDKKLKNHVMPITGIFNALLMFAYEKVSDISSEIIFLAAHSARRQFVNSLAHGKEMSLNYFTCDFKCKLLYKW